MSLSKYQLKQKQARRAARMDRKERMDSAMFAFTTCLVVAMDAAKQVWKTDASNPKMEKFLEHMFRTWQAIGDGQVSFETICDSVEAETKIRYDAAKGEFINLKSKPDKK